MPDDRVYWRGQVLDEIEQEGLSRAERIFVAGLVAALSVASIAIALMA
jgi:hypothetical protein